ncbi:MAG: efflux RND transporter permease subunit [Deltaproteobacteria bacterium]|nr:efflux RND transporter permease subunit [Deltaproteobacteria bacterium]
MHNRTDQDLVENTHNLARYFTEQRSVGWVLFVFTVIWGILGYVWMPKAKDPRVPIRMAAAVCVWPGASAERIEQLVTKRIEQKISENPNVEQVTSNTRSSVVVVYILLKEGIVNVGEIFDDLAIKLGSIDDLPQGAGRVEFFKDFGEVGSLLLTVASPKVGEVEIDLRSRAIKKAIEKVRSEAEAPGSRATIISAFPMKVETQSFRRMAAALAPQLEDLGRGRDFRLIEGSGFLGVDFELLDAASDREILDGLYKILSERMRLSEIHPDYWPLFIVRDPGKTFEQLTAAAGDKYTYRELDEFTEAIQRRFQALPLVSKVSRAGVLPERIYLEYSQNRLAALGVSLNNVDQIIGARNITVPGGVMEIDHKNVTIDPSGSLKNERELGDVLVAATSAGLPIYLRDLGSIERTYQSPPRFLNFLTWKDEAGPLRRGRAVTIAVYMRPGSQIADFGRQVDAALEDVRALLPEDLVFRRTSDQVRQVGENVGLFMRSLMEAIILVVLVALIGFWEWRSALLMALSIPITLAMTFGVMALLGLDIQQVSVASLILALGLLVDDPVVAGDAIKRSLGDKQPPIIASWLGPTKLASAILFATITNIVAYLPFLVLTGDIGKFLYSLPVVMTVSLVASRIVSMTFIPMLGYYLLRPSPEGDPSDYRTRGLGKVYVPIASWVLAHRKLVLLGSLLPLAGGFGLGALLKPSFFPTDASYLSYVDIWLPEDASLSATQEIAVETEQRLLSTINDYAAEEGKQVGDVFESLATFLGGGAPRFWFSVMPEQEQLNYAQIMIETKNKYDTPKLVPRLQQAVSTIPGARIDVRELENGVPVGTPIAVRIKGEDQRVLREIGEKVRGIFRSTPGTDRIRDDWGTDAFSVKLKIDPDRANFAGITNLEVAVSSVVGMNGKPVGVIRDGSRQIPIIARMRSEERAQLEDIDNLYVHGSKGQKVPIRQVSSVGFALETEKIRRRNHFRTLTVACFPAPGFIPSEVSSQVAGPLRALSRNLPPGYTLEIGGELEEQQKGFGELVLVLLISVAAIFIALVIQFKSAIKPVMVFASLPYGVAGALASVAVMGASFGFMAFMGVISLIGVIVSHIIVLFDLIEEMRENGVPLRDALIDAALLRFRPVAITVGATVLALVPLAHNGGALWEPLCYAQIGGLTVATVLTLVLVPAMYAVMVADLKWIEWPQRPPPPAAKVLPRFIPASVTQQIRKTTSIEGDRTILDVKPVRFPTEIKKPPPSR